MSNPVSCALVSDFNVDNLAGILQNQPVEPAFRVRVAPFGQTVPTLLSEEFFQERPDVTVVWSLPQRVSPVFAQILDHERPAGRDDLALQDVDAFCSHLLRAAEKSRALVVPTWTLPPWRRGLGVLELKEGPAAALAVMNARLVQSLAAVPNAFVFDAARWCMLASSRAEKSAKLWYLAKVAFDDDVFRNAALDIRATLLAQRGLARKLVVVDLDDTLWGGIVGDVGWSSLTLGGHDPAGEAFADFQRALRALARRGVLLGIVSKNQEEIALEAIRSHPEMILRAEDFAGWRINWQDKASNVADLADELNLGLGSVVFIDDNPAERGRVREALPEVLVPEWPHTPLLYPSALHSLACFDVAKLTNEDQERNRMYADERQRRVHRAAVGDLGEWLMSLETRVSVERLSEVNRGRIAQLVNKTNQMNLTTRRLTEQELCDWAREPHRCVWAFHVADRFGAAGLTGVVSLEGKGSTASIVDFVMSCRVMGKQVENAMLHVVAKHAKGEGFETLRLQYLPTSRNKPTLEFLESTPLRRGEAGVFEWSLAADYSLPGSVSLEAVRPEPSS